MLDNRGATESPLVRVLFNLGFVGGILSIIVFCLLGMYRNSLPKIIDLRRKPRRNRRPSPF